MFAGGLLLCCLHLDLAVAGRAANHATCIGTAEETAGAGLGWRSEEKSHPEHGQGEGQMDEFLPHHGLLLEQGSSLMIFLLNKNSA
jgi:hypothetical protein